MTDEKGFERKVYDQLFGIQRSSRYHNYRRRFYELWNAWTVGIAALGGLSSLTAYKLDYDLGLILIAFTISVTGALDLMIGTSRRSNQHAELAREFILLEAMFVTSEPIDERTLADLISKRLLIESREPPVMRLLDTLCHFELLRAMGDAAEHPLIPWHLPHAQEHGQPDRLCSEDRRGRAAVAFIGSESGSNKTGSHAFCH